METESDERKKELHAEMDALLLAAHALPWQRLVNSWRASAGEAEEAKGKVTEDDDDILIEEVQVGEQVAEVETEAARRERSMAALQRAADPALVAEEWKRNDAGIFEKC